MNISGQNEEEVSIIDSVIAQGHAHVFRFWSDLNSASRRNLLNQLKAIDFDLLSRLFQQTVAQKTEKASQTAFEPADFYSLPKTVQEREDRKKLQRLGEEILRQGRVATFLVAGGQGSRLSYDGPKGAFPISPVKRKSFFQLHAEKILALSRKYGVTIPWYIMTSESNHDATIEFFDKHAYFGLSSTQVKFFRQEMVPALDEKGLLIMDARDHVFVNPNGHGGSLSALKKSGALSEMKERGIDLIFYFQVDNVLVKMCDPVFLGLHVRKEAEMSAKVVAKVEPDEKLGILGKIDGQYGVIEYSDFTDEEKRATKPDGSLRFNAGSIAIHLFNVDFVEKENRQGLQLPWHIAHKQIPCLGQTGDLVEPSQANGYKFETFVFDALRDTQKVAVMEVDRSQEFSPVKNGVGTDSPASARQDMKNLYAKWLEAAGAVVPRNPDGHVIGDIEISPLVALEEEDLKGKLDPRFKFYDPLYLG